MCHVLPTFAMASVLGVSKHANVQLIPCGDLRQRAGDDHTPSGLRASGSRRQALIRELFSLIHWPAGLDRVIPLDLVRGPERRQLNRRTLRRASQEQTPISLLDDAWQRDLDASQQIAP